MVVLPFTPVALAMRCPRRRCTRTQVNCPVLAVTVLGKRKRTTVRNSLHSHCLVALEFFGCFGGALKVEAGWDMLCFSTVALGRAMLRVIDMGLVYVTTGGNRLPSSSSQTPFIAHGGLRIGFLEGFTVAYTRGGEKAISDGLIDLDQVPEQDINHSSIYMARL